MKDILSYATERFPAVLAFTFSFLLMIAIDLYLFATIRIDAVFFVGGMILVLFLFRVRLGDDIKDLAYDSKFHRDRPVQRGAIDSAELKKMLGAGLVVELLLQAFLFSLALPLYILLVFYWFLMFRDFFWPKFARQHFFIYILLHQLIFAFYVYYLFYISVRELLIPGIKDLAAIFFIFICMFIYEISRKMVHRYDTAGNVTDDTYIYRWGKANVLLLLALFFALQYVCLIVIFGSINLFLIANVLLIIAGFLFFTKKPAYFLFLIISGLLTFISYKLFL